MLRHMAFVFALLGLARPSALQASATCDYYRGVSKALYDAFCGGGGEGKPSRPQGTQSSMSESLNLSAASLPTGPTAFGIESLYSVIKNSPTQNVLGVGLVKGFKRRGAGLSIGGGNSFYDNDLLRRQYSGSELRTFQPYEEPKGKFMNLNLGAAVNVYQMTKTISLNVGGSLRYHKGTDTWGGGPSLLINSPFFSLGTGFTKAKIASDLPRVVFISSLASLRLFILELEYNRLDSRDSFHLGPVHIFTLSLKLGRIILTAAQRRSKYLLESYVVQRHYAAQLLLSSHFAISYMDNYIPGARTAGLQLYF